MATQREIETASERLLHARETRDAILTEITHLKVQINDANARLFDTGRVIQKCQMDLAKLQSEAEPTKPLPGQKELF